MSCCLWIEQPVKDLGEVILLRLRGGQHVDVVIIEAVTIIPPRRVWRVAEPISALKRRTSVGCPSTLSALAEIIQSGGQLTRAAASS